MPVVVTLLLPPRRTFLGCGVNRTEEPENLPPKVGKNVATATGVGAARMACQVRIAMVPAAALALLMVAVMVELPLMYTMLLVCCPRGKVRMKLVVGAGGVEGGGGLGGGGEREEGEGSQRRDTLLLG